MQLPDYRRPPQTLWDLLSGFRMKKYLSHSRQFNKAVAYSCFKCHPATLPLPVSDMRIQGDAYVAMGGMRAENIADAKFIQVHEI